MLTATVEIQYVNQPKPGKKMGSIKTRDGTYYNVWPDKLHLFQQGQTQTIEYQERPNNSGGKFLTAVGIVGNQQAPVQMPASDNFQASTSPAKPWPGPGTNNPRKSVHDAHKDEMIFVMNQAAAAVRAGQVIVGSPEYIPFINKLRSAYSATFGADEEAA